MTIGIVANRSKEQAPAAIAELRKALDRHRFSTLLDAELEGLSGLGDGQYVETSEMIERVDAVAVFGGDGTMLATGRRFAGTGIPLVGFNLGRLGFMAEFSVDEIPATIDALVSKEYRVVDRTLIEARIDGEDEPLIGLNDLVITKRENRLLVDIDVHVNDDYLGTYSADGLVIATPTGSTAYALAVGGPVIAPNASVFVVAPIAPHMLTARPIILSDDVEIRITPTGGDAREQEVRVVADGQNAQYLNSAHSCIIRRHPGSVSLIKSSQRTYFDILRAKLLWGRHPTLDQNLGQEG